MSCLQIFQSEGRVGLVSMTEYKERHKAGGGEVTYRVGDKGGQGKRGGSNLCCRLLQAPISGG